jgi:D-alanyl-D-alanine carboxypeptidase/D-alanyl-D-alanine-endopeptidase (penicillin-binding protein 4)
MVAGTRGAHAFNSPRYIGYRNLDMKKSHMMRAGGLAFLFPLTGAVAAQQQPLPPLQRQAEQIVAGASGEWGVFAWSIDAGRPLISINASAVMIPASNNKVLTAIWVLDTLGPDHRFETDLLVTGPIENGVLRGDVVIRGSGDPAFGYPPRAGHSLFVEDPMTPLDRMARRLTTLGVRVVEGDVVGDATAFDTVLVGPSWPNDTGAGAAQYAPRVTGLPFQRNMVWVEATPAPGGGPAIIRLDPEVSVVPVVSTVRTGGGGARAVRRATQDTIRMTGGVSGRGPHRYGVGVADPALLTTDALRLALVRAGIQVNGSSRTGVTPDGARIVHRHLSIPVGTMIPFLNQQSDNFFAEHLWKAAAREATGEGSYLKGGPAAALHFIQRAGVPTGEVYQFDGSGLSSLTRISANALVRALVYAQGRPYSDLWHASLAVAADPGGTMNRLYRGSAAAGNLHAKTGFISRVRTLSGYVRAANGELIAFSFLYNGGNTNGARTVQEQLGVLLADYAGQ